MGGISWCGFVVWFCGVVFSRNCSQETPSLKANLQIIRIGYYREALLSFGLVWFGFGFGFGFGFVA